MKTFHIYVYAILPDDDDEEADRQSISSTDEPASNRGEF